MKKMTILMSLSGLLFFAGCADKKEAESSQNFCTVEYADIYNEMVSQVSVAQSYWSGGSRRGQVVRATKQVLRSCTDLKIGRVKESCIASVYGEHKEVSMDDFSPYCNYAENLMGDGKDYVPTPDYYEPEEEIDEEEDLRPVVIPAPDDEDEEFANPKPLPSLPAIPPVIEHAPSKEKTPGPVAMGDLVSEMAPENLTLVVTDYEKVVDILRDGKRMFTQGNIGVVDDAVIRSATSMGAAVCSMTTKQRNFWIDRLDKEKSLSVVNISETAEESLQKVVLDLDNIRGIKLSCMKTSPEPFTVDELELAVSGLFKLEVK